MTNDKLWGYINKNLNKIKILEIEINKEEDNWGDEYHAEDSSEFTFILFSDEYKVGYCYVTEDADDWAQAETYHNDWCLKNGKWIDPVDVYNILENYQQLNRDFKLKQIL
jgi:hypothetical protein